MKKILTIAFIIGTFTAFGQTGKKSKNANVQTQETQQLEHLPHAAIFANGKHVEDDFLATIMQSEQILSFSIKKGAYKVGYKLYNGQVHVIYKDGKEPMTMSLNEALKKYTTLDNKPVIFMFDGKIVKEDYDTFIIKEENLLQFEVDEIINEKENINLYVIEILTRTEENIAKLRELSKKRLENTTKNSKPDSNKDFWIRGTGTSMNQKP